MGVYRMRILRQPQIQPTQIQLNILFRNFLRAGSPLSVLTSPIESSSGAIRVLPVLAISGLAISATGVPVAMISGNRRVEINAKPKCNRTYLSSEKSLPPSYGFPDQAHHGISMSKAIGHQRFPACGLFDSGRMLRCSELVDSPLSQAT